MKHRDNTYRELAVLYDLRPFLGHLFKSVTVRLNGTRYTVHTAEEADQIFLACPDIYARLQSHST